MPNERKLKIAFLLPGLRGGGAERVNLDLAHQLSGEGHSIEFVLQRAVGEFLSEAERAFSVYDLGVERLRSVPLALAQYLRLNRPDALLVSMWPLTVLAPIGRALAGCPCHLVACEHSMLSEQYRSWGRLHWLALRASLVVGSRLVDSRVGVSFGVVQDIAGLAWMRQSDYDVIHNPIPIRAVPTPDALEEAEALWRSPPGSRILTVGTFKAAKNYPLLLQAVARLSPQREWRLMLLGKGEGEAALRRLAQELGVMDRVVFAGFHQDPTPFYVTADLFVLSSNREGLPTVLIEALAQGTPVVSTDCRSGPSEILGNGRWGRLVPVNDVIALADAIACSLDSEHDRQSFRARAAEFTPAIAAKKYLNALSRSGKGAVE